MPHSGALSKPYRTADFLAVESLDRADEAVIEIFHVMFGLEIRPIDPDDVNLSPQFGERTAIVGFSGPLRGSCQVRIGGVAARSIASAMLGGVPIEEDDDAINDALGELCNVLAGSWKNAIPGLSSQCALSPPTVISGCDYKVHIPRPSATLSRTYRFDAHTLFLTLNCEDSGPT
jgi:chemotaxis protein CheX